MTYLPELKRAESIAPFWASVEPIAKRIDRQMLYYLSGDVSIDPDEGLLALRLYAELFLALFEPGELITLRDELDIEAIEADVDEGEAAAHDLAVLSASIARASVRNGELEAAKSWLDRASNALASIPGKTEAALARSHCLAALAEAQLERLAFAEAERHLAEARSLLTTASPRADRLRFDLALVDGTLRFLAADFDDALRAYGFATTLAHRHESPVEAMLGHLPLAALHVASGRESLAGPHIALALAVADQLPGSNSLRHFAPELPLNFVGRPTIRGMIDRGLRLLDTGQPARGLRFAPLPLACIAALQTVDGARAEARALLETAATALARNESLPATIRQVADRLFQDWPG